MRLDGLLKLGHLLGIARATEETTDNSLRLRHETNNKNRDDYPTTSTNLTQIGTSNLYVPEDEKPENSDDKPTSSKKRVETDRPKDSVTEDRKYESWYDNRTTTTGLAKTIMAICFGMSIVEGNKNKQKISDHINPQTLKAGFACIINHKTFLDTKIKTRNGTDKDVKRPKEVLERFGLTTKTIDDGTKQDIKLLMADVEKKDFSTYSCIIIFLMSHGYENDMLQAKDGTYSVYKNVLYPILRNKSLVGKPKLIFVQSCKGDTDPSMQVDSTEHNVEPTETPDEILLFHSCVEGYVSYRNPKDGSPFIQLFCKKLEDVGDVEDIREICHQVVADVKKDQQDMQIPMLHTNLTKPFVLGHYKQ